MGITTSNKEINVAGIQCGESLQVTLSLTAEPDIVSNPTDIVLVLDRSGSMAGAPLVNLKVGANTFIDILDEATDGSQNGQIGNGSRIGLVSFADDGSQDVPLTTSVADLKTGVNALMAGGSTNHQDAFTQAVALFDPNSTNAKVIVMFTDGFTTIGGDPVPVTDAAKAQGIIIYVIGLSGTGGIDEEALREWASEPDSAYVAITPDAEDLQELFEDLAENISIPGATDIVIEDVISPCFSITSLSAPTRGQASLVGSNTVRWTIDELGVTASEGAEFTFTVQHEGDCNGLIPVNESISYDDNEGNVVNFPSPEVDVDCGIVVIPEDCPEPVDIPMEGCQDTIEFDAGDLALDSMGRILEVDVRLTNVCPNRRVALAAILSEVDDQDVEYKRGLKTFTIPAHTEDSCRNVLVRCIKFVLPGDLAVVDTPENGCDTRNLRVRFIAHYIDNDFECCQLEEE